MNPVSRMPMAATSRQKAPADLAVAPETVQATMVDTLVMAEGMTEDSVVEG